MEQPTKRTLNKPRKSYTKAWIKNGILYNQHVNRLSAEDSFEMVQKDKAIFSKLDHEEYLELPLIVILKDIDSTSFLLKPTDVGKILNAVDFANTVGEVWFVGVPEHTRGVIRIIGTPFLKGTPHFCDTVEEAEKEISELGLAKEN